MQTTNKVDDIRSNCKLVMPIKSFRLSSAPKAASPEIGIRKKNYLDLSHEKKPY